MAFGSDTVAAEAFQLRKVVSHLEQENARLEADNELLRYEAERWGRRIKFLESILSTIRNIVR